MWRQLKHPLTCVAVPPRVIVALHDDVARRAVGQRRLPIGFRRRAGRQAEQQRVGIGGAPMVAGLQPGISKQGTTLIAPSSKRKNIANNAAVCTAGHTTTGPQAVRPEPFMGAQGARVAAARHHQTSSTKPAPVRRPIKRTLNRPSPRALSVAPSTGPRLARTSARSLCSVSL